VAKFILSTLSSANIVNNSVYYQHYNENILALLNLLKILPFVIRS